MKLTTAYAAFWFLVEHPKFKYRYAVLVSPEEAKTLKLSKGERIRKVKDDTPWMKGKTYLLREFAFPWFGGKSSVVALHSGI